jgi:uncharacterized membrane protein
MSDMSSEKQSAPVAEFVLHPHRSLSARGFAILMGALCLVSFAAGMVFVLLGAWPVMGFFGLDVALIYWAFKVNYRDGRAYETVDVTSDHLTVTRFHRDGSKETTTVNPYWARVDLSTHRPDGRTSLRILAQGTIVRVGQFLTDDERRDFAMALSDALRQARTVTY